MPICPQHFTTSSIRFLAAVLIAILAFLPVSAASAQSVPDPLLIERVAVVRGQGALLLNPGDRTAKAALPAGSLVLLMGRSTDGSLLYVASGAFGDGWVAAGSLLTVDTTELPIHPFDTPETTAGSAPGSAASTDAPAAPEAPTIATALPPAPAGEALFAQVTLTNNRLNLRSGPGAAYPIVAKAEPGSRWQVLGRDTNGDWLQLLGGSSTAGDRFWGASPYLAIDGQLLAIPVVTDFPAPPPAILVPTPAPGPLSNGATGSGSEADINSATNAVTESATGISQTDLSGTLVFNDRIGGSIYGYSLDSGAMWPLTTGIDPALSPDGQMVAFTRDGGGNGVYLIGINGGDERLLYSGHELLRSPKWSPDGRLIVFSRSNGYDDCRVLEGGVCLPDAAILDSLPPELQTGEAEKAVKDLPNQRAYHTILSRIGIDGNDYRDIPSLDHAGAPDWIDAGIVYHAGVAGIQQTADADGLSRLVVTDELQGYFLDPDWQPGGGAIAFYRKLGGHWQIHLVNPDGTGLTAITRPVTALVDELPSSVAPAWSPDGQHIVYVSNRNSLESAGAWHFWVMNADGSDQRRLPIDLPLEYTFSAEQMVSWGPSTGR